MITALAKWLADVGESQKRYNHARCNNGYFTVKHQVMVLAGLFICNRWDSAYYRNSWFLVITLLYLKNNSA